VSEGTEQGERGGMFSAPAGQAVGRRRTAPRAEETSDVRRFRGVLLAAVAAALAVLGAVVATVDPRAERAPGPVSRSHQAAGDCGSCHGDDPPIAARCVSCHGAHPSVRAGHRRLAQAGALPCTRCHAAHADYGGAAFEPDGTVLRFGPGAEEAVKALRAPPTPAAPQRVPIVPVAQCSGCHDAEAADDPIARCLLADQRALGPARPTVCFDEHRTFELESFSRGEGVYARTRLWAAARDVAAAVPVAPSSPRPERSAWWWLVVAAVAGGAGWGLSQGLSRLVRRGGRRASAAATAVAVPPKVRRLPQIDTSTCIGCHACVDACPYDVLEVRSFVAVVVRPDDCCGLTLCEQRCPNGSLVITEGEPIEDRPRVDDALQSLDTPGIYVAGDLTGLPLIRNAMNQGARAARAAGGGLRAEVPAAADDPPELLDLVVVGSGPAGLSASLAAAEAGLRTVTLEQGSVAESIRSFPRGKLVFDQPLGLPLEGELWLQESTKEELLGQWRRIIRARRLPIEEGARVTAVRPLLGAAARGSAGETGTAPAPVRARFEVRAETAAGPRRWLARRVILALGRRGTPRKLDVAIPDALASRVAYSMADARSFAGQRVLVVGLGDVAMEAAIALARQPGTTVTVSYRGHAFRRGKARNVEQVQRLAAAGRIDLRLGTEIERIEPDAVVLRGPEGSARLPWDALLVMIGSLAPWGFLEAAGVGRARVGPPAMPP
jgi:thioredoxin reductase